VYIQTEVDLNGGTPHGFLLFYEPVTTEKTEKKNIVADGVGNILVGDSGGDGGGDDSLARSEREESVRWRQNARFMTLYSVC